MTGSDNSPGMRFFRMTSNDDSQDIDGCSVMVKPFVKHYPLQEYMIQSGTEMSTWCSHHNRTGADNRPQGARASYVANGNNYVWGFEVSSSSGGGSLSAASWDVGDPYGVEIARIDLPKGYIFGSKKPNSDRLESASDKEVHFTPEQFEPRMSGNVQISAMRQRGTEFREERVDVVNNNMLDDKNN